MAGQPPPTLPALVAIPPQSYGVEVLSVTEDAPLPTAAPVPTPAAAAVPAPTDATASEAMETDATPAAPTPAPNPAPQLSYRVRILSSAKKSNTVLVGQERVVQHAQLTYVWRLRPGL